jgi:hypothetical protein
MAKTAYSFAGSLDVNGQFRIGTGFQSFVGFQQNAFPWRPGRRVWQALSLLAVASSGEQGLGPCFHVLVGRVEYLYGCLLGVARSNEARDALRGVIVAVVASEVDAECDRPLHFRILVIYPRCAIAFERAPKIGSKILEDACACPSTAPVGTILSRVLGRLTGQS